MSSFIPTILIAHNRYRESGGEDSTYEAESALLETAFPVVRYELDNRKEISSRNIVPTAINLAWSKRSYRAIRNLIQKKRPTIAHFHNTFPLMTASAFDACREENIPVIQTIHNYRTLCATGTFFRKGQVCTECVSHGPWHSLRYGCYRGSRLATAAVARMQRAHQKNNTLEKKIDQFIALTDHSRDQLIQMGIPAEKITIKPHFVIDPKDPREGPGNRALFVGRLDQEKGVQTAIQAFGKRLGCGLDIVGSGPQREELEKYAEKSPSISFLGHLPPSRVNELMRQARMLIFPSVCFEMFPRVLVEAMSLGIPIIASRTGGIPEIVEEEKNGLLFDPGNADDLARKVEQILQNPEQNITMGKTSREMYQEKYSPEKNVEQLTALYQTVLKRKKSL